jgi:hypothetical protein
MLKFYEERGVLMAVMLWSHIDGLNREETAERKAAPVTKAGLTKAQLGA